MADPSTTKYSWDILTFIQRTPCARESLISGIFSGFAIGTLYFLRSKHVRRTCDLTVGSFVLVSFATWELCRYRRRVEQEKLKQTVELLNEYSKMKHHEINQQEEDEPKLQ